MWKGVTDFLENVDQKAAEFAQKREGESPVADSQRPTSAHGLRPATDDEEDWDLEGAIESSNGTPQLAGGDGDVGGFPMKLPAAPTLPQPIIAGGDQTGGGGTGDAALLRQQLTALTRRLQDTQRQHDAKLSDLDKRYLALQGDFDAMTAKNRSLAIEVDHWQQKANTAQEANRALEGEVQRVEGELQELRASRQGESNEAERWEMQCNEQLGQLEEQRRDIRALQAQVRKASDTAAEAEAELGAYKVRSKISLDEKDRQLAGLSEQLQEAQRGVTSVVAAPQVTAAAAPAAPDGKGSETEAALRQAEERIRGLAEQLQQRSNDASKTEEALKAQMLLNAQLKELLDSEQSSRASSARSYDVGIAEKQAIIVGLEKKLGQLQTVGGAVAADGSSHDYEKRAKELAQLLMEKQASLEAKRAEVDQWRTRYEVSQQRLREAELIGTALNRGHGNDGTTSRRNPRYGDVGSAEAQHVDSNGDVLGKHRIISHIASRGAIGARVVGVAEQVDRFSLKAGGLLKQNSLLRVFLVCYVIILQLYMFVVISVSTAIPSGNAHEGVPTNK